MSNSSEQVQYPGEDKFMHFFELGSPANSFVGLPLVWGVRILSTIYLLTDLLSVFSAISFFGFLISSASLFASGCLLYSSIYYDYKWGFIGYFIHMIFFYLNVFFGFLIILFLIGFFFTFKLFLIFIILLFVFLAIKLAIMWIFYSYVRSLKPKNEVKAPENQTNTVAERRQEGN
jgi:hypothetical protein